MQSQIKSRIIIGLFIALSLSVFFAPCDGRAVYSPTLYRDVKLAKDHIKASRVQNGVGTASNAWDKWMAKEKEEAAQDPHHARIEPPNYQDAVSTIKNFKIKGFIALAWDEMGDSLKNLFSWLIGSPISACVRNDIYEMEDVVAKLSEEMVRTSILRDDANYRLLKQDFYTLQFDIYYLRNHPNDPPIVREGSQEKKPYLFPDSGSNYYVGAECPDEEWKPPFEALVNDFNYFIQSVSMGNVGMGGSWGSIAEMAQERAVRKANEWFKKNQIKLTLGGESGAATTSLLKNAGAIGAEFRVAWEEFKTLIGPITPFVELIGDWSGATCAIYDKDQKIWRHCNSAPDESGKSEVDQYKECKEHERTQGCEYFVDPSKELTVQQIARRWENQKIAKEKELERARQALQYQLKFQSTIENSLISFDRTLAAIENNIKNAYSGEAPALSILVDKFYFLEKKYCANRPPPPREK